MKKLLGFLLSLLLSVNVALAASPTINGAAVSGSFQGATTSGNVTKTCSAGDTVFVAVFITKQSSLATGTISGASLTWTMASRVQHTQSATNNNSELWYSYTASGITGATITLTSSAATDATEFSVWCVSGANSTTQLDPNISLPATYNAASSTTFTYSTSNADDLILSFRGLSTNTASADVPSGFTNLVDVVNGAGAVRYAHVHVDYKSVSAPQSSVTTAYGTAGETDASILVAATADAPPVHGGTGGTLTIRGVGN